MPICGSTQPDRIRDVARAVCDDSDFFEIQEDFAKNIVTGFARMEGRTVGIVANQKQHVRDPGRPWEMGGVIYSHSADKAARFMQLCDAHGLAVITLCDTPGMMVGPDVEATALVRHCSRLFVVGANLSVPMVSIVTRKSHGGLPGVTSTSTSSTPGARRMRNRTARATTRATADSSRSTSGRASAAVAARRRARSRRSSKRTPANWSGGWMSPPTACATR